MYLHEIGEIIAERKYIIRRGSGEESDAIVNIGKPQSFPDSPDYYTPFQIKGFGSEKVMYCGGVDAVQSLQLAMRVIGAELQSRRNSLSDDMIWEGDENGDLGFPLSEVY
jgi:hypothetical protein